jgi:hypothetical protein
LFYADITRIPSGPAAQLAIPASLNAVSIRVPSHTLNRCPPSCRHQCGEAVSTIPPTPMEIVTQDEVLNAFVKCAIPIHAPNIAFGCVMVATFAFKPPANTVNMPSASDAATAIIVRLFSVGF